MGCLQLAEGSRDVVCSGCCLVQLQLQVLPQGPSHLSHQVLVVEQLSHHYQLHCGGAEGFRRGRWCRSLCHSCARVCKARAVLVAQANAELLLCAIGNGSWIGAILRGQKFTYNP